MARAKDYSSRRDRTLELGPFKPQNMSQYLASLTLTSFLALGSFDAHSLQTSKYFVSGGLIVILDRVYFAEPPPK